MSEALLEVEGLQRRFGGHVALDGVTLAVEPGELFCLLGPSGCGKTTLLRLIGGYLAPDAGRIVIAREEITRLPPERRGIGMVFQNYALFPHLSARENVAFGLAARRVPREERRRRVDEMLDRVGLNEGERGRRPVDLSGGQQQRVALARALVIEPRLLLLDEPLANLDRRLREQLRGELRELQRRTNVTSILVTHDQEEALALATSVGVMFGGRLLQVGTPDEVYRRPRVPLVARFVGDANLLRVSSINRGRFSCAGGLPLPAPGDPATAIGDLILVRPEDLLIGDRAASIPPGEAASGATTSGIVRAISFLGSDRVIEVGLADEEAVRARVRGNVLRGVAVGDRLPVAIGEGSAWRIPERDPSWIDARANETGNGHARV